jgi:hypothetical protein
MPEPWGTVLVDQDGPLADWESQLLKEWRRRHPEWPFIELDNRRKPRAWQDYAELSLPVEYGTDETPR